MKNLPPFYIGQKVVCLKDANTTKKGQIYKVTNNWQCSCGTWYTGVGVLHGKPNAAATCVKCDCKTPNDSPYYLGLSTRFAPVQEAKPPLIKLTLSKIQEVEKEQILIEN